MAGFASDILGVIAGRLQAKMGRGGEAVVNILMTRLAGFRSNKSGSRDLRRSDHLRLAQVGARRHAQNDKSRQRQKPEPGSRTFLSAKSLPEPIIKSRFHNGYVRSARHRLAEVFRLLPNGTTVPYLLPAPRFALSFQSAFGLIFSLQTNIL